MSPSAVAFLLTTLLATVAFGGTVPAKCKGTINRLDAPSCCADFDIGCIKKGKPCSVSGTRGFPSIPCADGLTCVISNFGRPAVDIPNAGKCRKLRKPAPVCSVPQCTKTGASALCVTGALTTTCGAWAKRTDGGEKPKCDFFCTQQFCPKFGASNFGLFCTACQLQSAACGSDFEVFGPIATDPCKAPVAPGFAATCCKIAGIGCIKKNGKCSTQAQIVSGPVPCEDGLTCVITDLGFIAADVRNSGKCKKLRKKPKLCKKKRCMKKKPKSVCDFKDRGVITTCKTFLDSL